MSESVISTFILAAMLGVSSMAANGEPLNDSRAVPELGSEEDMGAGSTNLRSGPFAKGTWTLESYGSTTFFDEGHGKISAANIGVGYHVAEGLSLNAIAFGGWVNSEVDDDGIVGGLDYLLRWHLKRGDGWSVYVDGGIGFQEAETDFPSDSHHNFRPQIGLGGTSPLFHNARIMGGVRYLHISNGSTTSGNDGGDWAEPYLGVMLSF